MVVKFGAIMKACRERAGITQDEMAQRMHYANRSTISKLEADKKEPAMSTMLRWAQETGAQDVLVAFFCGMDGLSIMQNILDMGTGVINCVMMVA